MILCLSALLSAALAIGLTRLAVCVARRFDFVDYPRSYKAHREPMPLLGGVAVTGAAFVAFATCASLAGIEIEPSMRGLGVGVVIMVAAGLYDDRRGMGALQKLAWQALATFTAAGIAVATGAHLELFLDGPRSLVYGLTLVWILTITNAFNFADNMNGLCAGLGAIGALALGLANARWGQGTAALLSFSIAGACLGFLPYNYPRARIFLGDAGAQGLGFSLGGLAAVGASTWGAAIPQFALLVPVLALAIPLLDLVLVVGIRLVRGRAPWRGDRSHLSHRLVRRGLHPAGAVAILWGSAAILAALGISAPGADPTLLGWFAACLLLLLVLLPAGAGWRGLD